MKAAQFHTAKESAYCAMMLEAGIVEKRLPVLMRASAGEIDAVELAADGKPKNSAELIERIKADWPDFIVTTEIRGADTPNPPFNVVTPANDPLADAFKPKI